MLTKLCLAICIAFSMYENAPAQQPRDWDGLLLGRVIDQSQLTVSALQKMEVSRDPASAPILTHLVLMNLLADTTLAVVDRTIMPFVTMQMQAGIAPYSSLGPFHQVKRWVRGTWASDGAKQRIDVRITETETGKTLSNVTTTEMPDADLVSVARYVAVEAIRVMKVDGSKPSQLAGNSGITPAALAVYAEGVKLEGDGAFADAAKKFREAAKGGSFLEAERAAERMNRIVKWLSSQK